MDDDHYPEDGITFADMLLLNFFLWMLTIVVIRWAFF